MELSTLSYIGEDRSIYPNENCHNRWMDSRGNRGDTQGKPYENERGRPLSMLISRATGRYKGTKFYRVGKGVGFAHSTAGISRRAKPWEREGAILSSCFRRGEGRRLPLRLETPEKSGNFRGNYTGRPSRSKLRKPLEEDDRKAVFGGEA